MAFTRIDFHSQVLKGSCTVDLILPEFRGAGCQKPMPVLYLLHGFNGDHTSWQSHTEIKNYVRDIDLAVVMPGMGNSYYANQKGGPRYWDYLSEELPEKLESWFSISRKRSDCYVAGLSMGGYGALKLAFRYPGRFAKVAGFSSAVDILSMYDMDESHRTTFNAIFGSKDDFKGSPDDLLSLVGTFRDRNNLPDILLTCGTGDFLYGYNREFVKLLEHAGIAVTFLEKTNATHNWQYWDEMVPVALRWMGF